MASLGFSRLMPKFFVLLFLHFAFSQTASETCCEVQIVDGQGDVDGTYMLNTSPTAALEDVCLNSCIYTKIGDEPGREYCFKGSDLPGSVECSALPTEPPVTGSTATPSEDSLREDISSLDDEIAQDEAEFQVLQEQEAEAEELESGLDNVSDKIDELLDGRRQKRQGEETVAPASSCQEIAQLVEEMETETETKKRLKIVTKITTTTVISCTDENDQQFLLVKREQIKSILITVKSETEEKKKEIRKEKTKVSLNIVKNKKKKEKLLEKLDIMLNPTTMPLVPNFSETPISMAPSEETPFTMESTSAEETPIAMTSPGFGDTPNPGDVESPKPTDEVPTSMGPEGKPGEGPTEGTTEVPGGEQPIPMGPGYGSGEEPIPMGPGYGSGEEPIPMGSGYGSGEEPIPMGPGGEEPISMGPGGEMPVSMGPGGEEPISMGPGGEEPISMGPGGEEPISMGPGGEEPISMNSTGEVPLDMGSSLPTGSGVTSTGQ